MYLFRYKFYQLQYTHEKNIYNTIVMFYMPYLRCEKCDFCVGRALSMHSCDFTCFLKKKF